MTFIYGALSAGILWGGYLFIRNFIKSFSGESSKRFCIFSTILFGLLTVFSIYLCIDNVNAGKGIDGTIVSIVVINLFAAICSGINIKKQQK